MVLLELLKGFLVVLGCLVLYWVVPRRMKQRLLVRIAFEAARADLLNPNRHKQ